MRSVPERVSNEFWAVIVVFLAIRIGGQNDGSLRASVGDASCVRSMRNQGPNGAFIEHA